VRVSPDGAIFAGVFVRKAALRPVPTHARVEEHPIEIVEGRLAVDELDVQRILDEGFQDLETRQPVLADWLAEVLARGQDELVQSLGYFLAVTIYQAFREAFPTRLVEIDAGGLELAIETLAFDEQLRRDDPAEIFETDDVIAMSQPHLLHFVEYHVGEAVSQGEGELSQDELDRVYRTILVEVVALSHAVASPSGHVGPPSEILA
jgi:hypothetical protein